MLGLYLKSGIGKDTLFKLYWLLLQYVSLSVHSLWKSLCQGKQLPSDKLQLDNTNFHWNLALNRTCFPPHLPVSPSVISSYPLDQFGPGYLWRTVASTHIHHWSISNWCLHCVKQLSLITFNSDSLQVNVSPWLFEMQGWMNSLMGIFPPPALVVKSTVTVGITDTRIAWECMVIMAVCSMASVNSVLQNINTKYTKIHTLPLLTFAHSLSYVCTPSSPPMATVHTAFVLKPYFWH